MNGLPWPEGEYVNWKDSGCALHPSCLDCPLERCIEEVPRGRQRRRMSDRAADMDAMRRQGSTSAQVAAAFGVSLRTAQRALQKNRKRNGKKGGKDKLQDPSSKVQTINKLEYPSPES
jgi:hypothetical protein